MVIDKSFSNIQVNSEIRIVSTDYIEACHATQSITNPVNYQLKWDTQSNQWVNQNYNQ